VEAKVMNGMNALALRRVPKISIIVRKTYGQAFWNMIGTGTNSDFLVAWPTAEISLVDPEIAANVIFGGRVEESSDPRGQLKNLVEKMVEDSSSCAAAGLHYIHDIIDQRRTRNFIIEALEICQDSRTKGMSEHKLAS
jgi:methylmalonyl-CoA decarboxylase subunit alpha